MLYLLDADTLIRGDRDFYPLRRFPVFWRWLTHQGASERVKIPVEQYEEITVGRGELVEWLCTEEVREALVLREEADPALVARVTLEGYGNLNEDEIEIVGRDPFLISYALSSPANRCVVTFEVSAPNQRRGKRKIPDVCGVFGVQSCNLYGMMDALDFTTDWRP
ncbi:MAG TPA: DUF4411 family protein [Allosphingosinicella sp.]|jgi:hypothetical protein